MILEAVNICGVLAFNEPTSLNLRDMPPGLIAISGENGKGKTTLLEAAFACLYREFPTRTRKITNYATRPDAYIEIDFAVDGQGSYRARLSLDNRGNGSSKATLSSILPDGRLVPLNADALVSTYDQAVARMMPPPELVLASVFAAQNRAGSFASLDNTGRRELFERLLGLERYRVLEMRCKAAAAAVWQEILGLEGRQATLAGAAAPEVGEELHVREGQISHDLRCVVADREALLRDIPGIEAEIDKVGAAAARYETARIKYDALTQEIGRLDAQRDAVMGRIAALPKRESEQLAKLANAWTAFKAAKTTEIKDTSSLKSELATADAQEQKIHADADARIAENKRRFLDRATEIRAAVASIESIEANIAAYQTELDAVTASKDAAREQDDAARVNLRNIGTTARRLKDLRSDVALLDQVPCHGQDQFAGCQFLSKAQAGKSEIPELEAIVAQQEAAEAEVAACSEAVVHLLSRSSALCEAIAASRTQLDDLRAIAKDAALLDAADERIKGHEQRKLDATASAVEARATAHHREDKRVERRQAEIVAREAEYKTAVRETTEAFELESIELNTEQNDLFAKIAEVTMERGTLELVISETGGAGARLAELRREEQQTRAAWDKSTERHTALTTELRHAQERLAEWARRRDDLAAVSARLELLRDEHTEWFALQRAFSREGLPVIEIDNSGPEVSALTNQLLQAGDAGRWHVEIITQTAKASKGRDGSTMKETLEFLITDSERGGEPRELKDLSGGEYVFVDEAIKGAIAIYVNRRNPFPLRTCWRDETTGALSGANALRYMGMMRKQHELGGFHQTLFITHNPDAKVLADAQISLDESPLRTFEPPYEMVA